MPGVASATVNDPAGNATARYDETRVEIVASRRPCTGKVSLPPVVCFPSMRKNTSTRRDRRGRPRQIVTAEGVVEDVVLTATAAIEHGCAHPLAQAIVRRAANAHIVARRIRESRRRGACAESSGTVVLGNWLLIDAQPRSGTRFHGAGSLFRIAAMMPFRTPAAALFVGAALSLAWCGRACDAGIASSASRPTTNA